MRGGFDYALVTPNIILQTGTYSSRRHEYYYYYYYRIPTTTNAVYIFTHTARTLDGKQTRN